MRKRFLTEIDLSEKLLAASRSTTRHEITDGFKHAVIGPQGFIKELQDLTNPVVLNSRDYYYFLKNYQPEFILINFTPISSDKSWKLDPGKINNIKQYKSMLSELRMRGIYSILYIGNETHVPMIDKSISEIFDLLIVSDNIRFPNSGSKTIVLSQVADSLIPDIPKGFIIKLSSLGVLN